MRLLLHKLHGVCRQMVIWKSLRYLWPPYVIGQAITFLPCGFFYLLSIVYLFPRLILAVADWMSTILPPWCSPSANLGCRSETRCRRLAVNTAYTGHQKSPEIAMWAPSRKFVGLCQTISKNTSFWQLKRLVTLSTYRRYTNNCIYLSIYVFATKACSDNRKKTC